MFFLISGSRQSCTAGNTRCFITSRPGYWSRGNQSVQFCNCNLEVDNAPYVACVSYSYAQMVFRGGHPTKYRPPSVVCAVWKCVRVRMYLYSIYYSGPFWYQGNFLSVNATDSTGHSPSMPQAVPFRKMNLWISQRCGVNLHLQGLRPMSLDHGELTIDRGRGRDKRKLLAVRRIHNYALLCTIFYQIREISGLWYYNLECWSIIILRFEQSVLHTSTRYKFKAVF
jgi:hypothetical protein